MALTPRGQLMPGALSELGVDYGSDVVDLAEIARGGRAGACGGLDFGAVLVYVCPDSCESSHVEAAVALRPL